jgi:hypothetical protein
MRIKSGYLIHKFENGKFAVCKILSEFSSEDEALNHIISLTSGKVLEETLLNEYLKKETTSL